MSRLGPPPAPDCQLHPDFRELVFAWIAAGRPSHVLAILIGFRHPADFSKLMHGPTVRATPVITARLRRLAELVGWPPTEIYLPEAQ